MEELLTVLQEYKGQLASLEAHLQANPDDQETIELFAELKEAVTSTEEAYRACLDDSDPGAAGVDAAEAAASAAEPASHEPVSSAAQKEPPKAHIQQHQPQQQRQQKRKADSDASTTAGATNKQRRKGPTMHPANLYAASEPDFAALAAAHAPLARHLIYPSAAGSSSSSSSGRPVIDFTSWEATKDLTAALLQVDYGVMWDLPAGQLVPPVPNRANYIHWVADLLQLSAPPGAPSPVRGLDIGCGANLIYCLLGAAIYGWHMVGVDVTEVALAAAQQLVGLNPQLQGCLEVRRSICVAGADLTQVTPPSQQQQHHHHQQQQQQEGGVCGPLAGVLSGCEECFHFCMCNPPFFESLAEANQNPHTACGGTAEEMVTPGGELAFVRAMITDSCVLRGRVHWYSSMCGKKASMKLLRQELHNLGVTVVRTTELVQGKTSRWAIAWSFTVPPSTASMPLPRAQRPHRTQQAHNQQQQQQADTHLVRNARQQQHQARGRQQQQVMQSQLSFLVEAAASDGRKVLQTVAALLISLCGAQKLQVDSSRWAIKGELPLGGTDSSSGGGVGAGVGGGVQHGTSDSSGCVLFEVSMFKQRQGLQVVCKVVGSTNQQSSSRLAVAVEQVRADMALMWTVSDC